MSSRNELMPKVTLLIEWVINKCDLTLGTLKDFLRSSSIILICVFNLNLAYASCFWRAGASSQLYPDALAACNGWINTPNSLTAATSYANQGYSAAYVEVREATQYSSKYAICYLINSGSPNGAPQAANFGIVPSCFYDLTLEGPNSTHALPAGPELKHTARITLDGAPVAN